MHPTKESLIELIRDARKGEVVLPEFQRSFIWDRTAVEELLVSILNDYFIGSVLILNVLPDDHPFKARKIEGCEDPHIYANKMVLDGQQRLTSAHYALFGPDINLKNTSYPYRFFLNTDAALGGRWDEAVYSEPTYYQRTEQKYVDAATQYEADIVSFGALRDWETWTRWYDGYRDFHRERETFDTDRTEALSSLVRKFLNYQVALIELPQSTPLETVVEVFERINRTGEALGVFELLTARLWKYDINLRDLWHEALETHDLLKGITSEKEDRYPKFALQIIAVLRGRECKRKDLILLEGNGFREEWETATDYIEKSLRRLYSTADGGYGVVRAIGLPYTTMVPPLALILNYIDRHAAGDPSAYEKLHRWYWSSVFRERFGGSVESLTQRDYAEVTKWISSGQGVPDAVPTHPSQLQRNLKEVVRSGAVYKGVLCLVALRGARDFFSGDTIELHDLDDHHIFPQKHLKDGGYSQDERNTILNRTLIARDTNQRLIKAKKPSIYLKEMEDRHGRQLAAEILSTHFIDAPAIQAMREDSYEAFIAAREESIRREIVSRCVHAPAGIAPEPDSQERLAPGQEAARLDRIEKALRDLIDERLTEARGDRYWKQAIPPDTAANAEKRILQARSELSGEQEVAADSPRSKLDFCDFSDYEKIILRKDLWQLFEPVFVNKGEFQRHAVAARRYRNSVKHGRPEDKVEKLAGEAAVLWFERAMSIRESVPDSILGEHAAMEDCLRVLTRLPIPEGQQRLYSALYVAGEEGLSADDLVTLMGRRDVFDLSGVLGALGKRINGTPGFGATRKPGMEMVLLVSDDGDGTTRYKLRSIMLEALRQASPTWLEATKEGG